MDLQGNHKLCVIKKARISVKNIYIDKKALSSRTKTILQIYFNQIVI